MGNKFVEFKIEDDANETTFVINAVGKLSILDSKHPFVPTNTRCYYHRITFQPYSIFESDEYKRAKRKFKLERYNEKK